MTLRKRRSKMDGKQYRLREFVRPEDGHSLIVDASSGLALGVLPGLDDFGAAARSVSARRRRAGVQSGAAAPHSRAHTRRGQPAGAHGLDEHAARPRFCAAARHDEARAPADRAGCAGPGRDGDGDDVSAGLRGRDRRRLPEASRALGAGRQLDRPAADRRGARHGAARVDPSTRRSNSARRMRWKAARTPS